MITESESESEMKTGVERKFTDFFESWVSQLEDLVQVNHASGSSHALEQDPHLPALVSKLTAHFKLYYTVKWAHAHHDVLAFFSPSWLSPLETAYSWVTGWKPSMAFRLVLADPNNVLSPDQLLQIDKLRLKIKSDEDRVDRHMERHQMAMVDHHMVHLSHLKTRQRNGKPLVAQVEGLVDVAIRALLLGLERTMKTADCVRLKTLKGILDVLTPFQCLRFLASISLIQIRLRQCGHPKSAAGPQKYNRH